MSRTLKFYGASDDLFEIEGYVNGEPDEISPECCVLVANDHAGLIVSAHYSPGGNGCWAIGISQRDEDEPLPDWPMTWTTGRPSRGYSVVLTIETPDSAVMSKIGGDKE